jgi:hypothetical protein
MNEINLSPPPQQEPRGLRLSTPTLAITPGVAASMACSCRANIRELIKTWTTNPDDSHGRLVLPVALLIARRRLPGPADRPPRPTPWGLLPLALILAIRAWSYQSGEYWPETATIVAAVAALAWTCSGVATLRRVWPAVVLLAFMLTSEAGLAFARDAAGWFVMPLAILMVGLELAWLSWPFENAPAAQFESRTTPVRIGTMIMGVRR